MHADPPPLQTVVVGAATAAFSAGLTGCGVGFRYPMACKRFSAAARFANFLFGPEPVAFSDPTATCKRNEIYIIGRHR